MIGGRIAHQEPPLGERRYRTGRGGFDPEVAAQLARAKYVFRQRVVLGLVLAALVTAVLAWTVAGLLWWMHTALDAAIVGYLTYLRRQVRIEEDVRQRRAARFTGSRGKTSSVADHPHDVSLELDDQEEGVSEPPTRPAAVSIAEKSTAVALDFDDEDPIFDELRPAFEPPYRRAAGE